MAIEDAIRELTEVVKGSDESPESEVTYIEAPVNPSDGDTLTYDATSGKWVAGAPESSGESQENFVKIYFELRKFEEDGSTWFSYVADSENNINLDSDIKAYTEGLCNMIFVFSDPTLYGRGFGFTYYWVNPDMYDPAFDDGHLEFMVPQYGLGQGILDSTQIGCEYNVDSGTYQSLSVDLVTDGDT